MRMKNTLAVLFTLVLIPALALSNGVSSATGAAGSSATWMAAQYNQQQDSQRDTMNQRDQKQSQRPGQMQGQQGQMTESMLAQNLIGKDVYGSQGDEIGTIEEIVFDERHEQVSYVVLARGGFLGIGEDLHAIPWSMVHHDKAQDRVTVSINKTILEEQEGFGDQWPREAPQMGGTTGDMRTDQQQRRSPDYDMGDVSQDQEKAFEMRKASQMIGLEVKLAGMSGSEYGMSRDQRMNGQNQRDRDREDEGMYGDDRGDREMGMTGESAYSEAETVGDLTDLVISGDGHLAFGVLQPNTDVLTDIEENKVLAVPWERINIMPREELAVANLSHQEATQLTLDENELEQLGDPSFSQRFYSAIGVSGQQFSQRNGSDQYSRQNGMRNGDQTQNGDRMRRDQQDRQRRPQGQMGRTDDLQKWSDFTQQCLGPNMNKGTETVRGTIHNVGTLYTSPEAEAPDGLRFVVTTNENERITVYAGPRGEVSQQLNLYRGDQVTIRGTECEIENEQVLVATSIQSNGNQFELTQKNGAPQWESKNQKNQKNQQKQQQDNPRRR